METPDEFLENLLHYVSTRLGWQGQELERLHRRLDGLESLLSTRLGWQGQELERIHRRLDDLESHLYQRLAALVQQAAAPPPAPRPPGAEPIP